MNKSIFFEEQNSNLEDILSLGVLEILPNERFERLVRMAKRMFSIPIALVGFTRMECQGIESNLECKTKEGNHLFSFSDHASFQDGIVIIPDTLLDKRFLINPIISGDAYIRFFAGCPLKLPNGQMIGALCILDVKPRNLNNEDIKLFKDLILMIENEIAALQMATIDELTQISNRRGFLVLAQKSLDYCVRNGGVASLVFFDINNFKQINDQFGHLEGDKALTVFADLMIKNIRDSDIFARLGGDEFVALLINTSEKGAESIISKFQASLGHYNKKANRGYDISFSHGIPKYNPKKHKKIEDLLAEGDLLMYQCKNKLKQAIA